jgi:soluble lytic murein transglycosylase-like protein
MSSFDIEEVVESQKPVYEALVRQHNKKLKPQVVEEIAEALLRAGYQYQMDPRFLAAIIAVESDFDVNCLSGSGAMGLGQLMPFNLKEAGVKNPWNATDNIFGTARLLRGHLDDYKDRPNGTLLAVAAYNAGPGAVRRAGYKVPSGSQVQRYVWKVYYRYKAFAPDMF